MFAMRLFSPFLLLASSAMFASASPIVESAVAIHQARAEPADVEAVFLKLKESTDSILPQIDLLVLTLQATEEKVTPLINELTTSLDTATAELAVLGQSDALVRRHSDDELALLVSSILTGITTSLSGLLGSAVLIPGIGGLLAGVDASLSQVIKGLEVLLAGVLKLVANLVVNVAALLRSLAFGLTLASLGL